MRQLKKIINKSESMENISEHHPTDYTCRVFPADVKILFNIFFLLGSFLQ